MDLHRLAEERSVAYHRVIAERLRQRPEVLDRARQRVAGWLSSRAEAPFYALRWSEVLAGDPSSIAAFLVERSELAPPVRQERGASWVLYNRLAPEVARDTMPRSWSGS